MWNDEPGARAEAKQMALGTVRDWLPLVLVATVFDNLEDYTGIIRKVPIDNWLYRIDMAVFGVEPTVWIKPSTIRCSPTGWRCATAIFFIVPMFLGISLCLRGRGADFREMATSVMLQMWIGFFLFICFPAGPPRYYELLRHTASSRTHIPSLIGINDYLQGTWDTYDPLLVRSAFPSLHCSYGLMTIIYAWRFGDGVFPRAQARSSSGWCCRSAVAVRVDGVPAPPLDPGYRRRDFAVAVRLSGAPWLRARWPEMNRRPVTRGVVRDRTAGGTRG